MWGKYEYLNLQKLAKREHVHCKFFHSYPKRFSSMKLLCYLLSKKKGEKYSRVAHTHNTQVKTVITFWVDTYKIRLKGFEQKTSLVIKTEGCRMKYWRLYVAIFDNHWSIICGSFIKSSSLHLHYNYATLRLSYRFHETSKFVCLLVYLMMLFKQDMIHGVKWQDDCTQ
jgi:hypothetical protein